MLRQRFPLFQIQRFFVLCAFLVLVFALGGGSRSDIASLPILQPIAVIATGWFASSLTREQVKAVAIPLLFVIVSAVLILVQLVPLPYGIWSALPGRDLVVAGDLAAGFGQISRPIALVPDQAWMALWSLFVPTAVLLGLAGCDRSDWMRLVPVILALQFAGLLLAALQTIGGTDSPFYLYRITNRGMMVGWFANRNHFAIFLVSAIPMLAAYALRPAQDARRLLIGRWFAAGFGLAIVPILAVAGSRIGLALIIPAILASGWLYKLQGNRILPQRFSRTHIAIALGVVAAVAMIVLLAVRRDTAISRMTATDSSEIRWEIWRVVTQMIGHFFPAGSGYGSFPEVFAIFEPQSMLGPSYINHAHNDYLEILLTGGLFGALALAAGLMLFMIRGYQLLRQTRSEPSRTAAVMGWSVMLLLLLGSVTDYPLRTPALMALLAYCAALTWSKRTPPQTG